MKFNQYLVAFALSMLSQFGYSDPATFCPGYQTEAYQDRLDKSYETLAYGYHVALNLKGTPLNQQKVYYTLINTDTNTPVVEKTLATNNQIILDDINSQVLVTDASGTFSATKNRKLLIWGLDYQGYVIAIQINLTMGLEDIYSKLNNGISAGIFGLAGKIKYGYSTNSQTGISIQQDADSQLQQSGCGYLQIPYATLEHYYYMGNLHPKFIINVTGNLEYQLSHYTTYKMPLVNVAKAYKLNYTKLVEQAATNDNHN